MTKKIVRTFCDGRTEEYSDDSRNAFELDLTHCKEQGVSSLDLYIDNQHVAMLFNLNETPEIFDEPDHDDSVRCCPDCERPNQFGELCTSCEAERERDHDPATCSACVPWNESACMGSRD
jgi:hypothetical protein